MTSLFRSRQDAEELHDALVGRADPEVADRHADLLRTAALLTTHEPVHPRPEFTATLRERLMATAQDELIAASTATGRAARATPAPVRSTTRRRLGTLAASLAILGGTAGMAAAAQGALPGDPLYPIKRGGEQVVATLQPGPSGPGDLRRAGERLEEARTLQERGADTDLVVRSVEEFRTLSQRGAAGLVQDFRSDGDPESVGAVRDFTAEQLPRLDELAQADPAVEPVALDAADTLAAIDDTARALCPACGAAEAASLPAALSQGAGAATLSSLLRAPAQQARLDAEALASLDTEQIRQLGRTAEEQAEDLPELPGGGTWPVVEASPRGPVGTTLVTDVGSTAGGVVTGTTDAVDGLVGGLREGLGQVSGVIPRDTVVGGTVGGLTDTLDQALGGVSGITGALSGRTATED